MPYRDRKSASSSHRGFPLSLLVLPLRSSQLVPVRLRYSVSESDRGASANTTVDESHSLGSGTPRFNRTRRNRCPLLEYPPEQSVFMPLAIMKRSNSSIM